MSKASHSIQLIRNYMADRSNRQAVKELADLCERENQVEDVRLALRSILEEEEEADVSLDSIHYDNLFRQIMLADRPASRVIRYRPALRWWWAAAILLVGAGIYFLMDRSVNKPSQTVVQDIAPGANKAVLTLGDGSAITLDSAGSQVIRQGATVVQQQGGQLVYNVQEGHHTTSYNTLTTPRGGQFRVTLPDGTRVWLNAASSVRYPTVFTGSERRVDITGEVYFEVAKQAERPFRVNVNGKAEVEVLGTHFNINAYTDEKSLNTTLLEGAVKVSLGTDRHTAILLKPGQQAQVWSAGRQPDIIKMINDPDLDKVIAWKNGVFSFENMSLQDAMRQLERWYDIDVVYENGVPDIRFGGEMSRDKSLASLLRNLQDVGVRFRIEGRRLIITQP